jgi:hypothetical protein
MHPAIPPTPLPPLLFVLASAALCVAADAPVIERVLDDQGRETTVVTPSRSFEVRGKHLYVPPKDPKAKGFPGLSATLGGRPLLTTAASPTSLRFHVGGDQPMRKGQTLLIRVGGESVRVKVDVALTGQEEDGTGGDPPPRVLPFQITSFTHTSTPAGSVFRGKGKIKCLIDGMKLRLTLSYKGEEIRSRALKLAGEELEVSFGPFRKTAPVGAYALELSFTLNSQRKPLVRALQKKLAAEGKRGKRALEPYRKILRRAYLNVGGTGPGGQLLAKDRASQEAELRDWVLSSISELEQMLSALEEALALAQRIYFRAPGESSIDEARYLKWLVDKGHAKDEAGARRLLADTRFASRRGELDEEAWTTWVKDKLLSRLRTEITATRDFNRETLCPIDPKLEALVLEAQGELLELARCRPLFKRAKLQLSPELNDPGLPLQPRVGASPKSLRAVLAELRKRVGE